MVSKKYKCILLYILTLNLVLSPCQSQLEQVDPNIPDIEGMSDVDDSAYLEEDSGGSRQVFRQFIEPITAPSSIISNLDAKDYVISTTVESTPMVYFSGQLGYNQECSAYGDAIDEIENSPESVANKIKKLRGEESVIFFGSKICSWARARLECIPDTARLPPPNVLSPGAPKPIGGGRLKGRCKCLQAMGEKAVWIESDEDPKKSKCYIPAGMGYHSECDHDIFLPYGEIDETVRVRRSMGSAGTMCVPNSECDIGYLFTGKRCKCRKGTLWDRTDGTCNKGRRLSPLDLDALVLLILVFIPVVKMG